MEVLWRPMIESTNPIRREGVRRLSVVHFLIALIVLIVALPFLDQLAYGELIEVVLITLVFLSAVTAVGGRRRTHLAACVLVAPALVTKWIDHIRPGALPPEISFIAAIVFTGFIVFQLFVFMLRAREVTTEVLCASVATFLMMAFLGGLAFELVEMLVPDSFVFTVNSKADRTMAGAEALFFSFGALTEFDGDAIPVSRAARTLVMVESTAGLFYMAVLISRLVALYPGIQSAESTETRAQ